MGVNVEAFQAWEQSGPFVHAMVIDRGDLTPANRLTLTDSPFVDIQYAATYPAPVDAIISEIKTTESSSGTSFSDIVLSNGNGDFDSILNDANILRQQFTMYRGSADWSLATESFPEKFFEIFRGEVSKVIFENGGAQVRLKITPVKYQYDRVYSGLDDPILYGKCRNVDFALVNSATQEYRCATNPLGLGTGSHFILRDNGVQLTITTDYTTDTEGSAFQGKVTLTSSPAGKLTADVNWDTSASLTDGYSWLFVIREIVRNFVVPDYDIHDADADLSAQLSNPARHFCYSGSGHKIYVRGNTNPEVHQYSVTGQDIDTISYDSKLVFINSGNEGISLVNSGVTLFVANFGSTSVYTETLSTAYDIDTATPNSDGVNLSAFLDGDIVDFKVDEAGLRLYILDDTNKIYQFSFGTAYVNSTIAHDSDDVINLGALGLEILGFDISNEGKYLVASSGSGFHQFELMDLWEIKSLIDLKRSYYPGTYKLGWAVKYSPSGNYLVALDQRNGLEDLHQFALSEPFMLPFEVINNKVIFDYWDAYPSLFVRREITGAVLLDMVAKGLGAEWTVDRFGRINFFQNLGANQTLQSWETAKQISISDFYGIQGRHIRHKDNLPAVKNVVVTYDPRWVTQSPDELAGSVSAANRDLWGKPYDRSLVTNALADYPYSEDLFVETNFASQRTGQNGGANFADRLKTLWATAHNIFDFQMLLSAFSLLDDLAIGDILQANDSLEFPGIADADKMLVTGISINWSENTCVVEVFK